MRPALAIESLTSVTSKLFHHPRSMCRILEWHCVAMLGVSVIGNLSMHMQLVRNAKCHPKFMSVLQLRLYISDHDTPLTKSNAPVSTGNKGALAACAGFLCHLAWRSVI